MEASGADPQASTGRTDLGLGAEQALPGPAEASASAKPGPAAHLQPSGGGDDGQASAVRAPLPLSAFDNPDAMMGDVEDEDIGVVLANTPDDAETVAAALAHAEHFAPTESERVAVEQPQTPHGVDVANDSGDIERAASAPSEHVASTELEQVAAEQPHGPHLPLVAGDVQERDLRPALVKLLANQDLEGKTVGSIRADLEVACGLTPGSFDRRREEISKLTEKVLKLVCAKQSMPHSAPGDEDMGEERCSAVNAVYNVTFPHPTTAGLRAPAELTREEIRDLMLQALEKQQAAKLQRLSFLGMVVFREHHASGEVHYHVAVRGDRAFRFGPLKKNIMALGNLATHWSCSHDTYASILQYGYVPTPSKPLAELDPMPLLWPQSHPPLSIASRPPVTAASIAKRREECRRRRAEEGKEERRFEEVDLWPIVVNEGIKADGDAAERVIKFAKERGGPAMIKFCFTNESKLSDIVRKCWRFENVEQVLQYHGKKRLEILDEARARPCVCEGKWAPAAERLLLSNDIEPGRWRGSMLRSLDKGRQKGTLVCHVGLEGNEGKSWLLDALPLVFGQDYVFTTPSKSSFPLLGLDRCRLAILDDWRFGEDILSHNLQLLWFEGKPVMVARPQNHSSGHIKFDRDDPIFITTLEADLHKERKNIAAGDVAMMLKRLDVYQFKVPLAARPAPACAACFASYILGPPDQHAATSGSSTGRPDQRKRSSVGSTGSTPEAKKVASWSVDHVLRWLQRLELGHLAERFRDNGIDGALLKDLTEQEFMSELGLTKLQARKLMTRMPQ